MSSLIPHDAIRINSGVIKNFKRGPNLNGKGDQWLMADWISGKCIRHLMGADDRKGLWQSPDSIHTRLAQVGGKKKGEESHHTSHMTHSKLNEWIGQDETSTH